MTDPERAARGGASFAQVMGAFSLVLLLAFGAGVYLYFAHVAYARVAARHLPPSTELAVRVDVETMLVLEPLREHLLPLFDVGMPTAAALKPRHDRFRAHTGVELGRDLREVVVGIGPSARRWVVVFGGKFPRTGMIDGLEAVLAEEQAGARRDGATLVLERGPAMGQATDGALIIASDAAELGAALAGSEAYLKLGLPPEGAGGFAASLADVPLAGLAELEQASGALQIGTDIEVDAALRFHGETARPAPAVAGALHALGRLLPPETGVARALGDATVEPRRPNELAVRTSLRKAELDLSAGWLARAVRGHFGAVPGP